jgi:DNA polymerase-3 subunit epsilon
MKAKPSAHHRNPELEELRRLVAAAQSRLAGLETDYTREKSRVEAVHAGLFQRLRGHYLKRDRLRLAVVYRQKFLDSFVRDAPEEVEQAEKDLRQAKVQLDADYERMAGAVGKTNPLSPAQEAELPQIWQKLVKLYHPDHYADEPAKRETYQQLTATIHKAKHSGDTETLRKIAEDPAGFQRRHGWATLDFKEVEEYVQLKRLHGTLQKEIETVVESLKKLRASPDLELCQRADQKPGELDEMARERAKQLELEIADMEMHAEQLAKEIKKLSGRDSTG